MLDIPCFCECKLQKHTDLINKSTKPQKCLKSTLLLISVNKFIKQHGFICEKQSDTAGGDEASNQC